jgi:outer membrane immunogenic protein
MIKIFGIAAVALICAAPAYAAPFEGAYVGAGATVDNINLSGEAQGFGFAGAGATAFGGYQMKLGGAFIGLEGNIDLNTADAAGIDAKWGWGVGGRVGVVVKDSTGVYVRAGYQRNKIGADGLGSYWGDGVRMGGGIETGLTDQLSLRAEFNHVNYEQDVTNNQGVVALVFGF